MLLKWLPEEWGGTMHEMGKESKNKKKYVIKIMLKE